MNETPVTAVISYDFMKCQKCGRLCTKPEMEEAVRVRKDGRFCPCGSLKCSPVNLPWWGVFLPRVWKFIFIRLRGGLRGWRQARAVCLACGCGWQAVFERGTVINHLECPQCHVQDSAVGDISFADGPVL